MKLLKIAYNLEDAEAYFEKGKQEVKCACYVFETVKTVEEARKFYKKLEKIKE